jgi:ribokinase
VAAARSGAAAAILGAVGSDDFGRSRLADLERDGVDVADVAVAAGEPSGVALIAVEEGGQNRILYVPGATLTVTPEQAEAAVRRVEPRVVLLTLELPAVSRERLVAAAREIGATVVLNATPEPEEGRRLAAAADVLVVNEPEALALLATPDGAADPERMAGGLLALGPRCVVITLGGDGALVQDGERVERFPAPRVEVVDTTGAGDAFCGAMAARLAAGYGRFEAAWYGVVAGSLAVTRAGAQPSMPRLEEIEARMEE